MDIHNPKKIFNQIEGTESLRDFIFAMHHFFWVLENRVLLLPLKGGMFDRRGRNHLALPRIRDGSGTGYFLKAVSISLVAGGQIFRACDIRR